MQFRREREVEFSFKPERYLIHRQRVEVITISAASEAVPFLPVVPATWLKPRIFKTPYAALKGRSSTKIASTRLLPQDSFRRLLSHGKPSRRAMPFPRISLRHVVVMYGE